jgi:hypothetical protein
VDSCFAVPLARLAASFCATTFKTNLTPIYSHLIPEHYQFLGIFLTFPRKSEAIPIIAQSGMQGPRQIDMSSRAKLPLWSFFGIIDPDKHFF